LQSLNIYDSIFILINWIQLNTFKKPHVINFMFVFLIEVSTELKGLTVQMECDIYEISKTRFYSMTVENVW